MPESVVASGASGTWPVFTVRGVRHVYRTPSGSVTALDGVDLDVPAGVLTVLAGPSGSGKSTLLRILGLVERPTAGRVELYGRQTARLSERERRTRRRRIHLMFQQPADNLLGYLDVADNLRAAAQLAHARAPSLDLLDQLGLRGTARWSIAALSGGQQQRLALLTALAAEAEVVLADEPTSQLDEASAQLVVQTLLDLVRLGITAVVASHDEAILAVAPRIIRLLDGRVVSGGAAPDLAVIAPDPAVIEPVVEGEPW